MVCPGLSSGAVRGAAKGANNSLEDTKKWSTDSGRPFYFWVLVLPEEDENRRLATGDYLVVLWMTAIDPARLYLNHGRGAACFTVLTYWRVVPGQ